MLKLYIKATETLRQFAADTAGATGIEYVLIVGGIALVSIPAVSMLGDQISEVFNTIRCDGFPPICILKQ